MSVKMMALVFGSELAPMDRLVALAMADHASDDGDRVWPSIARLAAKVGLGTTATRQAVRRLEAASVIMQVRPGGGRGRTAEYRFSRTWIKATADVAFAPRGNPTADDDADDVNPTPVTPIPLAAVPERQRVGVGEPSTTEPSTTEPPRAPRARASFDTFWATYPRREGKRDARKAYDRALKRAHPIEVITGAARYRDDPNREAPFTAHPATWLNRDGWEDDPLPPRHAPPPDRAAQLLTEAVQEGYGDGHDADQGSDGTDHRVLPDTPAGPVHRDGVG